MWEKGRMVGAADLALRLKPSPNGLASVLLHNPRLHNNRRVGVTSKTETAFRAVAVEIEPP